MYAKPLPFAFSVMLLAAIGCRSEERAATTRETAGEPPATTSGQIWPLNDVNTMPAEIEVLSATTFRCSNNKCQLLGVKESNDPAVRERALEFSRRWFKSLRNFIGIANRDQPLQLGDGTCVVWVFGHDAFRSLLNVELVRAGLVEVDYAQWKNYTFMIPIKTGKAQEDWQGELEKAKAGHQRGEKPRVLFEWP